MELDKEHRTDPIPQLPPPDDLSLEERLQWLLNYWGLEAYYEGQAQDAICFGVSENKSERLAVCQQRQETLREVCKDLKRVIIGDVPWERHDFDLVWRLPNGEDVRSS